jgi:hypothetical protein
LHYSVVGGTSGCGDCSKDAVDNTYTCLIPGKYVASEIYWDMGAYKSSACGGTEPVLGPYGRFSTGPTAVTINSFTAEDVAKSSFSTGSILAIAGGVILLLLALWQGRKLLKGKSA